MATGTNLKQQLGAGGQADAAAAALDALRRDLLDLSARNPLLNYRPPKWAHVEFAPDEMDTIWRVLSEGAGDCGERIWPADGERSGGVRTAYGSEELERRCVELARRMRAAKEEVGLDCLYLACGELRWHEAAESRTEHRAPLLLLPVELQRRSFDPATGSYAYELAAGEAASGNLCLAERCRRDFGMDWPEWDGGEAPGDFARRVTGVVAQRFPGWAVSERAWLGLFSFAGLAMYEDLDPGTWPEGRRPEQHGIVRVILRGPDPPAAAPEAPFDEGAASLDPEELPVVSEADASQYEALYCAIKGRAPVLVIQGPPGTGKSQTITNLIAAALSEGRRVLFVAEKRAALEVVRDRLERAGLGAFLFAADDSPAGKARLWANVEARLKAPGGPLRAPAAERDSREAERRRLMAYRDALHRPGPRLQTPFEVYGLLEGCRTALGRDISPVPVPAEAQTSVDAGRQWRMAAANAGRVRGEIPDGAWSAWAGYAPYRAGRADVPKIVAAVGKMAEALDRVLQRAESSPALSWVTTWESLAAASPAVGQLAAAPPGVSAPMLLNPAEARRSVAKLASDVERYGGLCSACGGLAPGLEPERAREGLEAARRLVEAMPETAELAATALPDALAVMDGVRASLEGLPALAGDAAQLLGVKATRWGELRSLGSASESLGLLSAESRPWPAWAGAPAVAVLQRGRAAAARISAEREEWTGRIVWAEVPSADHLRRAAAALRRFSGSPLRYLHPEYRAARRQLKGFARRRVRLAAEDLEDLAGHIQRLGALQRSPEMAENLGPLFCGADSDWDRIGRAIDAAQSLAQLLGDGRRAANLLASADGRAGALSICMRAARLLEEIAARPAWLRLPTDDRLEASQTAAKFPGRWPLERAAQLLPALAPQTLSVGALSAQLDALLSARALARKVAEDQGIAKYLGALWRGLDTDLTAAWAGVQWSESAAAAIPAPAAEWLAGGVVAERARELGGAFAAVRPEIAAVDELCEELGGWGELDRGTWLERPSARGLGGLAAKLSGAGSHASWVDAVAQFHRLSRELTAGGLGVSELAEQMGPQGDWGLGFDYSLYCRLAEQVEGECPELRDFHGVAHDEARRRFAELDQKLFTAAARGIASRLGAAAVPPGGGGSRVADLWGTDYLRHYLQLKRKRPGTRRTLRQAGAALQTLQPCFLMSPLQVAQFLPRDFSFDMVVMDEASQIRPGEALGAVLRAQRAVVVGDGNQLPPTPFFQRLAADPDGEEGELAPAQAMESILDACAAQGWPVRRLLWHYRSKHESLIAFSNTEFYDRGMTLFPSPRAAGADLGVKHHFIAEPNYHRGRNTAEAECLIETLRRLLVRNSLDPERRESLGVAAMNFEQKEWIDEAIRKAARESDEFRLALEQDSLLPEALFVKNLEALQGDERDVVLISTVYGPDRAGGSVAQRFGPINSDGGWRRLNVLFTRAKKRVELFTSLRAADVVPEGKQRGVQALHDYLRFAECGELGATGEDSDRAADSPFETAVADVIRSYGYEVAHQVGVAGYFIDLGVRRPGSGGDFMLGIECDGWMYHTGRSVRERDWLRERVLRDQGWRLYRIWSPDWYHRRAAEIERLLAALRTAEAGG